MIHIDQLDFTYPGKSTQTLKGVTLHLKKNQISCLIGPSGSGKSTLLRLIAGFLQPDAGRITIEDQLVASKSTFIPPYQRSLGMVFQDYGLFPHLNVFDNVGFALRGKKPQRVRELLELVRLEGLEKSYPHELSGGQQQRVALARAMARPGNILLLDEPFSHLDPALHQDMACELRRIIQDASQTALVVTHDLTDAYLLGDLLGVMFSGQIVQLDEPVKLFNEPKNKEVATFLGDAQWFSLRRVKDHWEGASPLLRCPATQDFSQVERLIRPDQIEIAGDEKGGFRAEHIHFQGLTKMVTFQGPDGFRIKGLFRRQEPIQMEKTYELRIKAKPLLYREGQLLGD